jgi:type IV fimbrial biogenesis protein FimT
MVRTAGFTIVELMVTLVVLAIALAFAVPNLQAFVMNNRMTSNLNLFAANLALARSEAIKQNVPVVLCPSGGGGTCAEADWQDGWLVYADRDRDLEFDGPAPDCTDSSLDADEDCLLLTQSRLEPPTTVTPAEGVPVLVGYDGSGAAFCDADEDGAPEACSTEQTFFTLCDPRGAEHARALAISRTGRVSLLQAAPGGDALSCGEGTL